jgi:hypothetical protein
MAEVRPVLPYAYSVNKAPGLGSLLLMAGTVDDDLKPCRAMLKHKVTHVLVKNRLGRHSNADFAAAVAANDDLYRESFSGPTGTIYSVVGSRLREACGAGLETSG